MAEIIVISLLSINFLGCVLVLYFTIRPKQIKIVDKSTDREITKTAIMTPSGAFHIPKKRTPIYNTDESLWEKEQEN